MTGLFGVCGIESPSLVNPASIAQMQHIACEAKKLHTDQIYSDDCLSASRIVPKWQAEKTSPFLSSPQAFSANKQLAKLDRYCCWFDGEIYNWGKIHTDNSANKRSGASEAQSTNTNSSIAHTLVDLYHEQQGFSFLAQLEGSFNAVIYDKQENKVHLLNDRNGSRPFYWMVSDHTLIWSGAMRSFSLLPGISVKINQESVDDFLGFRYLTALHSWFENVELLEVATVLTWDFVDRQVSSQKYWWWSELLPSSENNKDIRDIALELGRYFIDAVQTLFEHDGTPFLTLTSGLDSRAILAALPKPQPTLRCMTYEDASEEPELEMARRIASRAGVKHEGLSISSSQWLISKALQTWKTDCVVPINQHNFLPIINNLLQSDAGKTHNWVNLHGGYSGSLKGFNRYQLNNPDEFVGRYRFLKVLARSDSHYKTTIERFYTDFQTRGLGTGHVFYVLNRMRHFCVKDSRLMRWNGIETRMPFMDKKLQERLWSLPDSMVNADFYLFSNFAILNFPEFYKNVEPFIERYLTGTYQLDRATQFKQRVSNKLKRVRQRVQPCVTQRLATYHSPLLQEPNRTFFELLFTSKELLSANFLEADTVAQEWDDHLRGAQNHLQLYGLAALEIWLRSLNCGQLSCI
jgi:asparagine synthase (glutamine-hydrolysing)